MHAGLSRLLRGSSRRTTSGSIANIPASAPFFISPDDKSMGLDFAYFSMEKRLSHSRAFSFRRSLSLIESGMLSIISFSRSGIIKLYSARFKRRAVFFLIRDMFFFVRSIPATSMYPFPSRSPQRWRSRVVLPLPLLPISATFIPSSISRHTFFNAIFPSG